MVFNGYLSRARIQTKILSLVLPLMAGIAGLAAVNLLTGSMLDARLEGTSASISLLSGYKLAHERMNSFLVDSNEETRSAVKECLNDQIEQIDRNLQLASSQDEIDRLGRARELTLELQEKVDELWGMHLGERESRTAITGGLKSISQIEANLVIHLSTISTVGDSKARSAEDQVRLAARYAALVRHVSKLEETIAQPEAGAPSNLDTIEEELAVIANPGGEASLPALARLGDLNQLLAAGNTQAARLLLRTMSAAAVDKAITLVQSASAHYDASRGDTDKIRSAADAERKIETFVYELRIATADFLGRPDRPNMLKMQGRLKGLAFYLQQIAALDSGNSKITDLVSRAQTVTTALAKQTEALLAEIDRRRNSYAAAAENINTAWKDVVGFADNQRTGASNVQDQARTLSLGAAALVSLFGAAASALLIVALKTPIHNLTQAMRALASGALGTTVSGSERPDEIGEMARALEIFKENAHLKLAAEKEAGAARERASEQQMLQEKEKQLNAESTRSAVETLAYGLKCLADGDLTVRLETPFKAELEGLRTDFNMSMDKVGTALAEVSRKVQSINLEIKGVQTGAEHLSQRTEQQATSVEETAAALRKMVFVAAEANQRADDVAVAAQKASHETSTSQEVVHGAVAAMVQIENSSSKISRITAIIERIAFQTNLLALNAGVEAARAGDKGKGFAVVAHEVRELAQRTAASALEIHELVSMTASQIDSGVSLVKGANTALEQITSNVSTITESVRLIAEGSRSQSTSIQELHVSINLIDQITRQNGGMAEETHSVVQDVAHQIADLHALLGNFQLPPQSQSEGVHALANNLSRFAA